ncbi:CASP-like protein 2B1 [Oryza brachyantha]|uniref:CASP-like protein 2B1 n=1 Tax=Oryza brachyantha TaxID=4533 RepID=UPI001ADCE59E|nr:CASP-like protein 2B1 [Oryza brachyantha]
MGLERRVKVADVALRCVVCGLAALAAALVGTASQTRTFFSLEKKARFTDMRALVFLVGAHAAAAGYSVLQLARCAAMSARGRGGGGGRAAVAWSVFTCDQAVAYALMAATAAALQSSVLGKRGQPQLQWMPICGLYGAFCRRVGEGLASAVAAGLASVLLAAVSAFNLFRLYGGKGSSSTASTAGNGAAATW